jgi:hypothetical protein
VADQSLRRAVPAQRRSRPASPGAAVDSAFGCSLRALRWACGVRKLGRPLKPSDLQRDRIYAPHRLAAARNARSAGRRAGRATWRRSTASSWRSTTISSSLKSRERQQRRAGAGVAGRCREAKRANAASCSRGQDRATLRTRQPAGWPVAVPRRRTPRRAARAAATATTPNGRRRRPRPRRRPATATATQDRRRPLPPPTAAVTPSSE